MNGAKFLLDSNIVIALLKGHEAVLQMLESKQCSLSDCAVSQITAWNY